MKKLHLLFIFSLLPISVWGLTGSASERAASASVNPNYPVTPGDTYRVSYNQNDQTETIEVIVDRDYIAQVPGLERFDVNGLTYYEFKSEVETLFNRIYPGSVPVMTISNPGVFDVLVKGEVTQSSEIAAWSFERLSTLISSIMTPYTSLRHIEIISRDGTSRTIDMFLAQRTGDMTQDPYISFGDTIILYPYEKQVTLEGEFRRPGVYQLKQGETLWDVVEFQGGGFTSIANREKVEVKRPFNRINNEGNTFYLNMGEENTTMDLMDMDIITASRKTSFLPVVHLQGAIGTTEEGTSVSSKVDVTITDGERLSSVARKVQDQFTKVSNLESAYIVRSNGQNIPVNIEEILLSGDPQYDVILEDRDIIVIPFRQYYIYVSGQVNDPGRFPYIINKTWEYYVNLAGGFNIDTHIGQKVRIYDDSGEKHSQKDRVLQPEDVIHAPRNHPMYWIGEYGADIALITTSITSAIILLNYMARSDYPTP